MKKLTRKAMLCIVNGVRSLASATIVGIIIALMFAPSFMGIVIITTSVISMVATWGLLSAMFSVVLTWMAMSNIEKRNGETNG